MALAGQALSEVLFFLADRRAEPTSEQNISKETIKGVAKVLSEVLFFLPCTPARRAEPTSGSTRSARVPNRMNKLYQR